jgi:hypothetical protein
MTAYLPTWATLAEAERWLTEETGEPWPLPRLIEAGCRVHAWMDPPPPGSTPLRDTWIARLFEGRAEGYLAEFVFGSDTARMLIDRSAVMSMTRTPSGVLVKFDPPIPVDIGSLRFARDELQGLASASHSQLGQRVKKSELIERHRNQWPKVREDIEQVSGRCKWLAPAKADQHGYWYEGTALALARQHGRIKLPADTAPPLSWSQASKRTR